MTPEMKRQIKALTRYRVAQYAAHDIEHDLSESISSINNGIKMLEAARLLLQKGQYSIDDLSSFLDKVTQDFKKSVSQQERLKEFVSDVKDKVISLDDVRR